MFNRQAAAEGLTKHQRAMLARYQTVLKSNDMRQLLALDDRPKRQVRELAAALDKYGTPEEREMFIDAERSVLSNAAGVSLLRLPDVRTALAREAVQCWPLVRALPFFAEMEGGMRASGHGDEVFDKATFIHPEGATAMVVWFSAFGGPSPISMMDMTKQMTCAEAVSWLEGAAATFNYHVNLIINAQRSGGRVKLPRDRPGPGLDFTFSY